MPSTQQPNAWYPQWITGGILASGVLMFVGSRSCSVKNWGIFRIGTIKYSKVYHFYRETVRHLLKPSGPNWFPKTPKMNPHRYFCSTSVLDVRSRSEQKKKARKSTAVKRRYRIHKILNCSILVDLPQISSWSPSDMILVCHFDRSNKRLWI